MKKDAIEAAIVKARQREITYPQFVGLLREAGVRTYHVDVPSHTLVYRNGEETYTEHGHPVAPEDARTPAPFDESGIKAAIAGNQQGKGDYLTFLRQIWASGVTEYDVDLGERTVTYRGAAEAYMEAIPSPSS
jgi:uncharacterized protein YbcV (DUF1398 family)